MKNKEVLEFLKSHEAEDKKLKAKIRVAEGEERFRLQEAYGEFNVRVQFTLRKLFKVHKQQLDQFAHDHHFK